MFAKLVCASYVINPKKFQFFWIDLSSNLYSLFCKSEKTASTFFINSFTARKPYGHVGVRYINRHGKPTINALVAFGATLRCYLCDTTNGGATHDANSFSTSELNGYRPPIYNGIMGGDSAFTSNLENLVVPYDTVTAMRDPRKENFNDIFVPKRNTAERGIGKKYTISMLYNSAFTILGLIRSLHSVPQVSKKSVHYAKPHYEKLHYTSTV